MENQPNLFALVHATLLNQPEVFKLWFNGSACVGPVFTVVLDTWRARPTIIVRTKDELSGEDLQRSTNVEVEIPFWWRRRIVKAARRVVIRAAMQRVFRAQVDLCSLDCCHLQRTKGHKTETCAFDWPGTFNREGCCLKCPMYALPESSTSPEGALKNFSKNFSKGGGGSTS